MEKGPQSRKRIEGPTQRRQRPFFHRHGLAPSNYHQVRSQRLVLEYFAGGFTARRHTLPPDKRSIPAQVYRDGLLEPGASVRNQLVRHIFEVRSLSQLDLAVLRRGVGYGTAAVDTRSTSSGNLSLSRGPQLDAADERVGIEHPAREVVNMSERFPGWCGKAAHHAPGRLLPFHSQDGRAAGLSFERKMKCRRGHN